MKNLLKLLFLMAIGSASASAQVVVAAWDTWDTNVNAPTNLLSADADLTIAGVSALVEGLLAASFHWATEGKWVTKNGPPP